MVLMICAIVGFAAQQVATAPVEALDVAGNIEPARQTFLDFGVTGVVQAVNVKAGQAVQAGAVLAQLDDATLSAQVTQAQAAVDTAGLKMRQDAETSPAAQAEAAAVTAVATSRLQEAAAEANLADTARLTELGVEAAQLGLTGGQSAAAAAQVQLGAAQANLADIQRSAAAAVVAAQQAVDSAAAIGQGAVNAAEVQLATAERNLSDQQKVSQKMVTSSRAGVSSAQATLKADQTTLATDTGTMNSACMGSPPAPPTTGCTSAKETVAADTAAVAADQAMVKTAQAKLTQDQATANQDVNQAAATVANDQATLKNTQIAAAVAVKSAQTTLAQTQAAARQAGDQAAAQLAASQVSLQAAQGEGIGAARNALQQAQAKGQQSNDQGAAQLAASRFARASAEQALASFPQDALLLQLQQDQDQVNAARSVLAVAQHNASKGSIVAPVAGVVDHVNVVAGQSAGPPAVTTTHAIVLETPDAFQLTAPVRDSVITRVVRGAIVQVTPAGSPQTLVGTITDIAPSATVRSGITTFDVTATFEAKGVDVRPGMSAKMRIYLGAAPGASPQPVPGLGSPLPAPSSSPSPQFPELPTLPGIPSPGALPEVPSLPALPSNEPPLPSLPPLPSP